MVLSLQRIRGRLPLVVFLFLALLVVMLVGVACACLTDHPMQALERALASLAVLPAVVDAWALATVALGAATLIVGVDRERSRRASPAVLQRFLF